MGLVLEGTPRQWGRTTALTVGRDADGDWEFSDWPQLVLPGADGTIHHGHQSGSTMPDTVVVCARDRWVALADAFAYVLENQYCYDGEYYLVLRVRQLLEPADWQELPWGWLGPGDVFCAWDKFHWLEYSRQPDDDTAMSYGGGWKDLQTLVDLDHPMEGRKLELAPVSDATVLRAVRERNVSLTRALLDAGGNPDAGWATPSESLRSVSMDRNTYALLEAARTGPGELVAALLAAGAAVDGPPGSVWTPLQGALSCSPEPEGLAEIVSHLLSAGADPDAGQSHAPDQTPRALAYRSRPHLVGRFVTADRTGPPPGQDGRRSP